MSGEATGDAPVMRHYAVFGGEFTLSQSWMVYCNSSIGQALRSHGDHIKSITNRGIVATLGREVKPGVFLVEYKEWCGFNEGTAEKIWSSPYRNAGVAFIRCVLFDDGVAE